MDFTINTYTRLLQTLTHQGFYFQTFEDFIKAPDKNVVVLRHDVDRLPENSLKIAQIENNLNITGTFYFRMVKKVYDERIIKDIAALGHEIGYHYETLHTCKGNMEKAYEEFVRNLKTFRKIVPITTISMHGSPLSSFDNRAIWNKYDYRQLGLLAEPYFDINFNEVFCLTDTGRRWDGYWFNIRDKATEENPVTNPDFLKFRFRRTQDIIAAVQAGRFPERAMINSHPQRWTDSMIPWLKELVFQNIKNQVKRFLVKG